MSELSELVAAYNQAEAEQMTRLHRIFDLVASGPAPRNVKFETTTWSNIGPDSYREPHMDRFKRAILSVNTP
jgi:hypothetical protein